MKLWVIITNMFNIPYCDTVRPQGLPKEIDIHPHVFFDQERERLGASQGKWPDFTFMCF